MCVAIRGPGNEVAVLMTVRETEPIPLIAMTFDQWQVAREHGQIGPGTNTGDGHVWPRPDGHQLRCGGPRHCPRCTADAAMLAISTGSEAAKTGASDDLASAFATLAEAAKALMVRLDASTAAHAVRAINQESSYGPSHGLFQQDSSWFSRRPQSRNPTETGVFEQ